MARKKEKKLPSLKRGSQEAYKTSNERQDWFARLNDELIVCIARQRLADDSGESMHRRVAGKQKPR
jgi:hypothetical protein